MRTSDMAARREHERLDKLMQKEDRRARRIRAWHKTAALHGAPLGDKAKSIKLDRRGRMRHKEARERKGEQVRLATFTKLLYSIQEKAKFEQIEPKAFEVGTAFERIVEDVIRNEKRGKAVGRDDTHAEMFQAAPDDAQRC